MLPFLVLFEVPSGDGWVKAAHVVKARSEGGARELVEVELAEVFGESRRVSARLFGGRSLPIEAP